MFFVVRGPISVEKVSAPVIYSCTLCCYFGVLKGSNHQFLFAGGIVVIAHMQDSLFVTLPHPYTGTKVQSLSGFLLDSSSH